MAALKLVSLNVELSKHLDLIIPFLQKEQPDVVCLQEVMEYDVPRFKESLGMEAAYVGSARHPRADVPGIIGVGMLSRAPMLSHAAHYYAGTPDAITDFDETSTATKHATYNRAVLACDFESEGDRYRIATTHFTWTPDGEPDEYQRTDMREMLTVLEQLGPFVLCGDFNAPRGGEMFGMLASRYADNIPPHYTSSIDGALHRRGPLPLMVDGLFTTPEYAASDVRLEGGVSDHLAIVATIQITR